MHNVGKQVKAYLAQFCLSCMQEACRCMQEVCSCMQEVCSCMQEACSCGVKTTNVACVVYRSTALLAVCLSQSFLVVWDGGVGWGGMGVGRGGMVVGRGWDGWWNMVGWGGMVLVLPSSIQPNYRPSYYKSYYTEVYP